MGAGNISLCTPVPKVSEDICLSLPEPLYKTPPWGHAPKSQKSDYKQQYDQPHGALVFSLTWPQLGLEGMVQLLLLWLE